MTAHGVYHGLKAAVKKTLGRDGFGGVTVAVQGLGAVGYALCGLLHADGASLIVNDLRAETMARASEEFSRCRAVGAEEIFAVDCDVFAPCALGAQINARTAPVWVR